MLVMTYDSPGNTVTECVLRASWNNIHTCAIHLLLKHLDSLGWIP